MKKTNTSEETLFGKVFIYVSPDEFSHTYHLL